MLGRILLVLGRTCLSLVLGKTCLLLVRLVLGRTSLPSTGVTRTREDQPLTSTRKDQPLTSVRGVLLLVLFETCMAKVLLPGVSVISARRGPVTSVTILVLVCNN